MFVLYYNVVIAVGIRSGQLLVSLSNQKTYDQTDEFKIMKGGQVSWQKRKTRKRI